MRLILTPIALAALACLLGVPAHAASFDCKKARTPLEKAICEDPQLGGADERLARSYKAALAAFPVTDFVRDSQRVWLQAAPLCLKQKAGRVACVDAFEARAAVLDAYPRSRVYTSYGRAFTAEGATLLVYERAGATWLEWFGHWMPDAYRPRPYPDGFLAHDAERLKLQGSQFVLEQAGANVMIADDKLTIAEPGISLSARQGPIVGEFLRVH